MWVGPGQAGEGWTKRLEENGWSEEFLLPDFLQTGDTGFLPASDSNETLALSGPEAGCTSDRNGTLSSPGSQVSRLHPVKDAAGDWPCRSWDLPASVITWVNSLSSIKQAINKYLLLCSFSGEPWLLQTLWFPSIRFQLKPEFSFMLALTLSPQWSW